VRKTKQDAGFKFEKALKRIEEIVDRMESGEVELDQALALYQEASQLMAKCQQALTATQTQIKKLVKAGDGYRLEDKEIEEG
jgi:exodeoxyribonuclease VII small subunit